MTSPEANTNVVVISWNALDFTHAALKRLFETVKHPYALTVVDNGSTDGTQDYLDNLRPGSNCTRLRTILNNTNLGPGAAYSQGYDVSRELGVNYTAMCNNDLYFQDRWLERLELTMDGDSSIGILGTLQPVSGVIHPFTSSRDAKGVLNNAPPNVSVEEELRHYFNGEAFDTGADMMVRANRGGVRSLEVPPDAVPTSCAIVRNSAVEEVGFIADPRYEVYGSEDIDLSWELGRLGYKCAIQKDVYVHHFRHRSVQASGLDIDACLTENNQKFVEKWSSTIVALLGSYGLKGVSISELMDSEGNKSFLKLRRINDNVGFWKDGKLLLNE